MAHQAQRDYYKLHSASGVIKDRIDALKGAIPLGSTILDIGCNDGTISNALLERGIIRHSYCFDLEDIVAEKREGLTFQTANLVSLDLATLPNADGVLLLNILHHIIGRSPQRARDIIDQLLIRYKFVIVDLGSFSEKGDWAWRRAYDKTWQSDAELWNDIFAPAASRFKLLRYPTQGSGHRVLWKLYRDSVQPRNLRSVATYKRTPGIWPKDKQLHQVDNDKGLPENLVHSVVFEKAISEQKDIFWIKRHVGRNAAVRLEIEMELSNKAREAVKSLQDNRQFRDVRTVQPLNAKANHELHFAFEPDLFEAKPVHFQDWSLLLDSADARTAFGVACRGIFHRNLPRTQLLFLCDFQATRAWDGLALLDFEPNQWVIRNGIE